MKDNYCNIPFKVFNVYRPHVWSDILNCDIILKLFISIKNTQLKKFSKFLLIIVQLIAP